MSGTLHRSILALAVFAAVPVFATGVITSNPNGCGTDADAIMDNGDRVMTRTSIEAIEYLCEFDTLPPLSWDSYQLLTRKGYCAGPNQFDPQVFAFVLYPQDPGEITVYDQRGLAGRTIYYVCDAMPSDGN